MIDEGREPACGGMAGGAIGAIAAVMFILRKMAGITMGGCALVDLVDMAALASQSQVFSIQFIPG